MQTCKNVFFFILLLSVNISTSVQAAISKEKRVMNPNRLIHEKSPYLLQHAYNPVNWFPWRKEAFEKAREQGKAIFISIGYSTCHWCHVMAHESFEDREIGTLLNNYFVCIKVDREERPDIDRIYMAATQAMTGTGGWPMSLFLFPDGKPFFAGTYFPPEAKLGRPGFPDVIEAVQGAWTNDRQSLRQAAESVVSHLQDKASSNSEEAPEPEWMKRGFETLSSIYDQHYGGFGNNNKFPRPVIFDFFLRYYKRSGNDEALKMVEETITNMMRGGIYDHLGGGFHRYSVDVRWRVPHFEKMLYDQAQLIVSCLELYQITGNDEFASIAEETIEYVLRDMQNEGGGFFSAEDADSVNPYQPGKKSEGAYYLWKQDEIETLLGNEQADIFGFIFGIARDGNALDEHNGEFGDTNILYLAKKLNRAADRFNKSVSEIKTIVAESKKSLFASRQKRLRPHRDEKIIAAWNGLMITALARGAVILNKPGYQRAAIRAADFLKEKLVIDGRLRRRFRDGDVRFEGGLEDYAFFVQGLLALYSVSHEPKWLEQSIGLTEKQFELFADERGGFFESVRSDDLPLRLKGEYDGAEPAGNSVAALNLIRLGRLIGNEQWVVQGYQAIRSFGSTLENYPGAMVLMYSALDLYFDKSRQIIVAGCMKEADTREMLQRINRSYLPNTTLLLADGEQNQKYLAKFHPVMENIGKLDNKATAYICENFVCQLPINNLHSLEESLNDW